MAARNRRLSRRRRIAYVALACALSLGAAVALAEFAARWYFEGGFLAAVDSVTGWNTASRESTPPLVEDDEIGFKLNPDSPGVNSLGVRADEPQVPKPPGRFRVVLLGDSIAFPLDGFYRDLRRELVRRGGERVEVLNAAVFGYTTYQERRFLERDLMRLEPDLVVLQYCMNDNYRFLHRISSRGQRLLTDEAKEHLFGTGDDLWTRLARSSHLVYGLRRALLQLEIRSRAELPWSDSITEVAWRAETWPEAAEHLASMARTVAAAGGRFAILCMPLERQLQDLVIANDAERAVEPQRRLREICAAIDVPMLDVHAEFKAHRDDALYTDGLHLTPAGHRLVGRLLVDFLVAHGLVPER